ncbi:ABC transporter permease [Aliivibrio fischeri]|uniref:ABC transporter permease n=1 Tax=Aliivibrio fischeri TaxID=668 RepID=UPI0007C556D7|nr:ABC transporter permease [Aliivibrio fischeri]
MMALFSQTIQTLLAHRLRGFLAILAIVWGIISVLVLVALGEGFYQINMKSFSLLMNDTQVVFLGQSTTKEWKGRAAKRLIVPSEAEVRQIRNHPAIENISVIYSKWDASVTDSQGRSLPRNVTGIDDQFIELRNAKLSKGSRQVNHSDLVNHKRVALVSWQLADIGSLHIGSSLNINGIPFRVIGITKKNEDGILFDDARQAMIPSTVFTDLWESEPDMLFISPVEGVSSWQLRKNILSFFANQQYFDPNDKDAMYMPDFGQRAAFFKKLLRGIQLFLGANGAMTLAVGSLGVANIMFLSVTERTREIGVRLAIGATPNNILGQFLIEGGILIACGTAIGIVFSYGIVMLLNMIGMPEWLGEPMITLDAIKISLGVTAVLALLAAYFPARRASNLLPVIALSTRA